MSWCLQCGTEGKPERAVGVDDDGEPACRLHRAKEIGAGLNAATEEGVPSTGPAVPAPVTVVYKQAAERPAPDPRYGVTKAVSSAVDQQPAAAPSPVQTKTEDEIMDEKFCSVGGCGKKLRSDNGTGYCKPHRNELKKTGAASKAPKPKTLADLNEFHGLKRGALIDATKVPADALIGSGAQTTERVITLQLGESKVQKLLDLLLQ